MKGKKKGKRHAFKHVTKKEKHNKPGVTGYISRSSVAKKLQLDIHQLRKLCIFKGIHPVEPGLKRIRKQRNKTWYYLKDVNFMNRDEIVNWFFEMQTYKKRAAHLEGKKMNAELTALKKHKPRLNMDHFVRERYPTLQDAVNDIDDALCLISLFVEMQYGVAAKMMKRRQFQECVRLKSEWMAYVAENHALRRVFVSIKGIYYQADVLGSTVTWLVPHSQRIRVPKSIDVKTMAIFVEFYTTMLNFVFYRLYTDMGLQYPPQIDQSKLAEGHWVTAVQIKKQEQAAPVLKNEAPATATEKNPTLTDADKARIAIVNKNLSQIIAVDAKKMDKEDVVVTEIKEEPKEEGEEIPKEFKEVDEKEGENKEQYINKSKLFSGFKFFINREIPKAEIRFMIRSFGGQEVSELECDEHDGSITHQVVDRDYTNLVIHTDREYIQPQWIFDSINTGILMPYHEYAHNAKLPPHISPFVSANAAYVPAQKDHLDELIENSKGNKKPLKEEGERDEEEDENVVYEGENDEEDPEDIESQYARELAAEQGGKSYAGYVQDQMGQTEMYEDDDSNEEVDSEVEAALKKKPLTKKQKAELAQKKDEEERETMSMDLLNSKTKKKVQAIKKKDQRISHRVQTLQTKRADIEKRKRKEEAASNGKRKETTDTIDKPAKKVKK